MSHRCHSRCQWLPTDECGRGTVCRDSLFPGLRNHPVAATSIAAHGAPPTLIWQTGSAGRRRRDTGNRTYWRVPQTHSGLA